MSHKILIVDDSETARNDLRALLTDAGYECHVAVNGKDGLDVYDANQPFNLVISDINMPEMNGLEMCSALRQKGGEQPSIIIVSSDGLEEQKAKGKEIGVKAWVIKPYQPNILLAGIKTLLKA